MNKFDDIFSRKAKEAFDNYNADQLAEAGWNAYVSKHGRSRRRSLLIPLWARAASIIILVTAGVLFINRLSHRDAGETSGRVARETGSKPSEDGITKADTATSIPVTTAVTPGKNEASAANNEAITDTGAKEPVIEATVPVIVSQGRASLVASGIEEESRQVGSEKSSDKVSEPAGPLLAAGDMAKVPSINQSVIASEVSVGSDITADPLEIRLTDEVDGSLNLNSGKRPGKYSDLPREKMATTIMTGVSGMMASVDNATSTSQGVSIGFYVEQQLTPGISVRPGLAMARHNYVMEGMPGGTAALDYSAPELNGMDAASTSLDANIDVVSMEVPVNFVFSLRKRARSNLFVSTGASTVIYLSQHLTGNFTNTYARAKLDSYGDVYYEFMTTSVKIETEEELLNRIDLMGLANFSAGYSFPFAGTSQLLFEPFVQLPIRDLTSLNLRIRYGGLSMKIKF